MSKKKKSKKTPREKRNSNWFNDEGYYDPTVGQALRNIAREEAQKRRQKR